MHISAAEQEKLMLHMAGELAGQRKARGLKLNYMEAVAYISTQLLELARDGHSVTELMSMGTKLLRAEEVMDGVADMLHEVQVEATFPDGTKLVTVHNPIPAGGGLKPGETISVHEEIELNQHKKTKKIKVTNGGDRPVQVGSHYHFSETNSCLEFDRAEAQGYRLDIPSGTSVRFEPGETIEVNLVELGGKKEVYGLNGQTEGRVKHEL